MKNIIMIAAIGKNNELGKNGDMIWRIKEDLRFFKEQTMGKPMIMGYNTFFSLRGGKPLPGRKHIILTSRNIEEHPQILVVRSLADLLRYIKEYGDEVMVIGGGILYRTMLEYSDKLILTEIDASDSSADTFFPKFDRKEWCATNIGEYSHESPPYKRYVYTRK